jgi:hypothetical protein
MALADTARLIASLELQDKFSKNAAAAERALGGLEKKTSTLGKVGAEASRGMQNATRNIGVGLLAGGALLATQVRAGVQSLTELAEVTGQTEARLESTGGTANVTADEVRGLSEELENLSTVDDKVIQSGQNMLLTFTNIRNEVGEDNDIFDQATKTALNMSVALGQDMTQSALQLGKALNDPIRGIGQLRRVGVAFTDEQTKQIEKLVESGRVMDAQKIILRELAVEFGHSAEKFGKGPGAVMRRFGDAVEEGQQALARGILPVLERVSEMAQKAFGDEKVIAGIEQFGQGLGQGIEQLIDIATRLPWGAIGDSLKVAGTGARAVLTAFTSLPPWVQTAVLTGWGLNKLTGGALGNIAGTLARGAFGAIRGATPATPVFTKEVGLAGGAPVAGTKGGGLLGGVAKFVLGPVAAIAIGSEIAAAINQKTIRPAADFEERAFKAVVDSKDLSRIVGGLEAIERQQNDPRLLQQTSLIASNIPFIGDALGKVGPKLEEQRQVLLNQLTEMGLTRAQAEALVAKAEKQNSLTQAGTAGVVEGNRYVQSLIARTEEQTGHIDRLRQGQDVTTTAVRASMERTAGHLTRLGVGIDRTAGNTGLFLRKDMSPRVDVRVNSQTSISVNDVVRAVNDYSYAVNTYGGKIGDIPL